METVFLFLIGLLFLYEGVALFSKRDGDTITEIMRKASARPLVPFLFGLLCGHIFWCW